MQDLVTNWPSLVITANPQSGLVQSRQQAGQQPVQQAPTQPVQPQAIQPQVQLEHDQQVIEDAPNPVEQASPPIPHAPDQEGVLHAEPGPGNSEFENLGLEDRCRPTVPPPSEPNPTDCGWASIRRLGGWKAFLVEFPLLEEISEQHKGALCSAWKASLTKWKEASTEYDAETALLWMGFWSQCLQRKPSRGGRQGRVEVANRYDCVCYTGRLVRPG